MRDPVIVALETDLGTIEIELFVDRAPRSAGDFLTYVDHGKFDGAAFFYRAVRFDNDTGIPPIAVLQGGLMQATGAGVPHEDTRRTGILHRDGIVSLARGSIGTGSGSAFFICIGAHPALDFGGRRNSDGLGFAAFGKVVAGMDIVRAIHMSPTDATIDEPGMRGQMLSTPVMIRRAYRVRGRTRPGAAVYGQGLVGVNSPTPKTVAPCSDCPRDVDLNGPK